MSGEQFVSLLVYGLIIPFGLLIGSWMIKRTVHSKRALPTSDFPFFALVFDISVLCNIEKYKNIFTMEIFSPNLGLGAGIGVLLAISFAAWGITLFLEKRKRNISLIGRQINLFSMFQFGLVLAVFGCHTAIFFI